MCLIQIQLNSKSLTNSSPVSAMLICPLNPKFGKFERNTLVLVSELSGRYLFYNPSESRPPLLWKTSWLRACLFVCWCVQRIRPFEAAAAVVLTSPFEVRSITHCIKDVLDLDYHNRKRKMIRIFVSFFFSGELILPSSKLWHVQFCCCATSLKRIAL